MAEYVRRLRDIVGGEELLQVPSVSIALRDADGRVLLARHAEGGVWLLPGGATEPTEIPADAAVREMFEESGLFVRLTGLVGIFWRTVADDDEPPPLPAINAALTTDCRRPIAHHRATAHYLS